MVLWLFCFLFFLPPVQFHFAHTGQNDPSGATTPFSQTNREKWREGEEDGFLYVRVCNGFCQLFSAQHVV